MGTRRGPYASLVTRSAQELRKPRRLSRLWLVANWQPLLLELWPLESQLFFKGVHGIRDGWPSFCNKGKADDKKNAMRLISYLLFV